MRCYKKYITLSLLIVISVSCRVTFITGYDQVIDETLTKMKRDFNLHWIKLSRTLQDTDPDNQAFTNFIDYYDNLEADLIVLKDRAQFLPPKSDLVKKEITNLDLAFTTLINLHKAGLSDNPDDDRHDIRNSINSALDAVIKLEEELKNSGQISE